MVAFSDAQAGFVPEQVVGPPSRMPSAEVPHGVAGRLKEQRPMLLDLQRAPDEPQGALQGAGVLGFMVSAPAQGPNYMYTGSGLTTCSFVR